MIGPDGMLTAQVSETDIDFVAAIRRNVNEFLAKVASQYATGGGVLLDIAPQVHEGARPYFHAGVKIETLDIDPSSGCTHIGDICHKNEGIEDGRYDYVVCTEVLEHTLQPFAAVEEIWRMLRPNGVLFLSVPFNFRIHGPLPDCWRFTEHGLRVLLSRFVIAELKPLETPDRALMPIHYTVVAIKGE